MLEKYRPRDVLNKDIFSNTWSSLWEGMDTFFGDAKYEDDDGNAIYEFEVPGFNKENLEVSLLNGILTISGRRETKNKSHAGTKEIFKRLTIGQSQETEAEIRDGILYLTLKNPKSEKKVIKVK